MLNERLRGAGRTNRPQAFGMNLDNLMGARIYDDSLDKVLQAITEIRDVQRNTSKF